MNKNFIKIITLSFFISFTACSYKPIFSEKNYNFEIAEVFFVGEKKINRIIENKLNLIKKNDDKTMVSYVLNVRTKKQNKIISKNSKGDPLKFEMSVLVEYNVLENGNLLLERKIQKKNIYNNDDDLFKLEQSEKIILENLTENISDMIVSSIINLNDN